MGFRTLRGSLSGEAVAALQRLSRRSRQQDAAVSRRTSRQESGNRDRSNSPPTDSTADWQCNSSRTLILDREVFSRNCLSAVWPAVRVHPLPLGSAHQPPVGCGGPASAEMKASDTDHQIPVSEPGSYRDFSARVFYAGRRVFRGLGATAIDPWRDVQERCSFRRRRPTGRSSAPSN